MRTVENLVTSTNQEFERNEASSSPPHEDRNMNKQKTNAKETPMPWGMLLVLLSIRLSEPVNDTLILPFVYKMVEGFGIAKDPKDVAFYSGLLFTSNAFCQALTVMHWGRLSDRIGRRPVLFIGLVGNLISIFVFGLAKSFWVALAARSFNGLLSGNVVVLKSIIAEISDETNRPRMMAYLPLMWNVGSIAGAAVGGIFADPAHQYPGLFGSVQFFNEFPYFLPCITGCSVTIFSLVMAVFKLKETLVLKDKSKHLQIPASPSSSRSPSSATLVDESTGLLGNKDPEAQTLQQPKQRSIKKLLTPTVVFVMATNFIVCLAMSMGDQVYPIFAATPIEDGGLEFESRNIGFSLAVATVAVFYVQIFVYPNLERKYGALFCYRRGQLLMTIPYIIIPFLSIIPAHIEKAIASPNFAVITRLPEKWDGYTLAEYVLLWALLISLLLLVTVAKILAITSVNLLTVNIAPSRFDLGFMNGAQQMAMTITRIIGPLLTGIIWSWSIKHSLPFPFNSHLVWTVALALTVTSYYISRKIPQSVNKFAAKDIDSDNEDTIENR